MQIKTTVTYYFTSVRMAIISKSNKTNKTGAGEDVEKGERCCSVGGSLDWCSHYGKQYGITSKKKLKMDLPMAQQFHF